MSDSIEILNMNILMFIQEMLFFTDPKHQLHLVHRVDREGHSPGPGGRPGSESPLPAPLLHWEDKSL